MMGQEQDGRIPIYVRFVPRDVWLRLHARRSDTIETVKGRVFEKLVAANLKHRLRASDPHSLEGSDEETDNDEKAVASAQEDLLRGFPPNPSSLPHDFVATAPGVAFHQGPSSLSLLLTPPPTGKTDATAVPSKDAVLRAQPDLNSTSLSPSSSPIAPITSRERRTSGTPKPLAIDVFGDVVSTGSPPDSLKGQARPTDTNLSFLNAEGQDTYQHWAQRGLPGNREALEKEQEALKTLLGPNDWSWAASSAEEQASRRVSIDSYESSLAAGDDGSEEEGDGDREGRNDCQGLATGATGIVTRGRSGTVTAASSGRSTQPDAFEQQQEQEPGRTKATTTQTSPIKQDHAKNLIHKVSLLASSNTSSGSRRSSLSSLGRLDEDLGGPDTDNEDSMSSVGASEMSHGSLRSSPLNQRKSARRRILGGWSKAWPGSSLSAAGSVNPVQAPSMDRIAGHSNASTSSSGGQSARLSRMFSRMFVVTFYADGRTVEDWLTLGALGVRRYELLEIQTYLLRDQVSLPRRIVWRPPNAGQLHRWAASDRPSSPSTFETPRKAFKPYDEDYVHTFFDGPVYVFKKQSDAAMESGALGVWKLRRIVIRGHVMMIYRPKKSAKRLPGSNTAEDMRTTTSGAWNLSLLSAVASTTTGVAIDPPLYTHVPVQSMPNECIQVRMHRTSVGEGMQRGIDPLSPTIYQATGFGNTRIHAQNSTSQASADTTRPSLAFRCLSNFDHSALLNALTRELEHARERTKTTGGLSTSSESSVSVDGVRRQAVGRAILANISRAPFYRWAEQFDEPESIETEQSQRWDDSSSESEMEADVVGGLRARAGEPAAMGSTRNAGDPSRPGTATESKGVAQRRGRDVPPIAVSENEKTASTSRASGSRLRGLSFSRKGLKTANA